MAEKQMTREREREVGRRQGKQTPSATGDVTQIQGGGLPRYVHISVLSILCSEY